MFYLIATILCNTVLFVLFKLFAKYKVDMLQSIVFNYWVCVITGCIYTGRFPVTASSVEQPWFFWSLLLGVAFISLFNLIGFSTQKEGMTATTIANKLSLVIPVLFSFFLYDETVSVGKIAGIALAFPAVYLSVRRKIDEGKKVNSILWPAVLFIGSGLLDTLVKYVEHNFLQNASEQAVYVTHSFVAAALVGSIVVAIMLTTGKRTFSWRNVLAGIILGIPNFFSIYLLIKLLHSDFLQSSAAIPVNNIGIVLLSALIAILFFKEKSTPQRIAGIVLSVIAILLIALADLYGRSA